MTSAQSEMTLGGRTLLWEKGKGNVRFLTVSWTPRPLDGSLLLRALAEASGLITGLSTLEKLHVL